MAAGYSRRTLAEKLGIKPGMRVIAVGAPPGYAALLAPLPADATLVARLGRDARLIHAFFEQRAALDAGLPRLAAALARDGALWISWPKRSAASGSPRESDLTENVVRAAGLALGLVDVKVCAVDERWSGLKFVRRLRDR
ncbi:MAG TPA: DUF3052 domain-containing protein [Gemmatimonadales bacterium]|nr:DUF3052 domain-containing protein [Gemmatimonadales bacterium]